MSCSRSGVEPPSILLNRLLPLALTTARHYSLCTRHSLPDLGQIRVPNELHEAIAGWSLLRCLPRRRTEWVIVRMRLD
jgi:hypothetical protein